MPWFGKEGMGVQFETKQGIGLPIEKLVEQGYLKKVTP
jgi:filamentous hemagglutinin